MTDEAETGHSWRVWRKRKFCNFCFCDADSEQAANKCPPRVPREGLAGLTVDELMLGPDTTLDKDYARPVGWRAEREGK